MIALAYPGLFSYRKLLNLKKRDFELWAWKAQKTLIERDLKAMNIARIAGTDNVHYSNYYNEKQKVLFRLEGKLEAMQKAEWADLKRIGRG